EMDFRSDIYSLGCMLYHMLSGERPYEGGTAMEVMLRHLNEPPPPILKVMPACPMPLVILINKMLAKHPSGRHPSYAELIADLWRVHDIVTGKAAPVLQPAPAHGSQAAGARVQRQSRGTVIAAVGLLALAAIGVCFWAPWKPTSPAAQPEQVEPQTPKAPPPATTAPIGGTTTTTATPAAVPAPASETAMATATPAPATPPSERDVKVAFFQTVAALPPAEQVQRVVAKLKELNPDFDTTSARFEASGDQVTELTFITTAVTELWPVTALRGLQKLNCGGRGQPSPLANIAPLQGLPLTELRLHLTQVSDLSPLRGMKLGTLFCPATKVTDISPLAGIPLTHLAFGATQVSDLSPLRGMAITNLYCESTPITDLTPLQGMPLATLIIRGSRVSDLSPLQGAPLTFLHCASTSVTNLAPIANAPLRTLYCDAELLQHPANAAVLRAMTTLERINNQPASVVLESLPAAPIPMATTASTPPSPAATPTAPAPVAPDPWDNAVNLLAMIDPTKDRVGGTWNMQAGNLTSGNQSAARMEIPYEPPDEYDFRVTFIRREANGAVVQFLTQSGHPFAWEMGGDNNTICRFVTSAERWGHRNFTIVPRPNCLQNGRTYTSRVEVRRWGAAAYLDDRLVSQSRFDYRIVDLSRYEVLRDDRLLGLGSINGSTSFLRAELLEITGRGKPRR
ncbi:MAG: hypothetical protein HZA91_07870, partial [Verrucomicrobia bacterium]|nr:hypothetical protein [Verrucomicrobiota bacterium]